MTNKLNCSKNGGKNSWVEYIMNIEKNAQLNLTIDSRLVKYIAKYSGQVVRNLSKIFYMHLFCMVCYWSCCSSYLINGITNFPNELYYVLLGFRNLRVIFTWSLKRTHTTSLKRFYNILAKICGHLEMIKSNIRSKMTQFAAQEN